MGIEWMYKTKGDEKTKSSMNKRKPKDKNTSSSGCMSVIFNLFDLQHHHHFRFHHPSFMSQSTSTITHHQLSCLQGIEAPRSSFESPETAMDVAKLEQKVEEQTNLNVQVSKIKIKTKGSRFVDDLSSECSSSSPGTKTPSLVARLMGLDLLPEYSSPRASSSSTPANSHHPHCRSLPSTPRLSSCSRRSTDYNDYHHRLSLQLDKENCRGHDDVKTQYAKHITNQVRERINRRLGTDITNTVSMSPVGTKDRRRDSDLVLVRPKKTSVKPKQDELKIRLLDIKNNLNKPISNSHSSSNKEVKTKSKCQTQRSKLLHKSLAIEKPVKNEKIKRIASERFDLRLKKMNQQEDVFVSMKKSSKHGLNVKNNTTRILCYKKEMTSCSSTARSSKSQVSRYKPDATHNLKAATTTSSAVNGGSFSDHFNYITKIINKCGINSTTLISSGQWHSHSHPLDPSIFHQLEKLHHPTATATTTTTRKMIFELVNESLVEILKPYMNQKPWVCRKPPKYKRLMYGSDLIRKLCEMVGDFPAARCEVLEDIDELIDGDIWRTWVLEESFEAEGEGIVKEIENEIAENLLYEIVTEVNTLLITHLYLKKDHMS